MYKQCEVTSVMSMGDWFCVSKTEGWEGVDIPKCELQHGRVPGLGPQ